MSVNPRDKIRRTIEDGPQDLRSFLLSPRSKGAARGFCQALQLEVAGTCFDEDWEEPGKKWLEFPWVTLVLGSGPVGLPDPFWAVVRRLPELVNATIEECRYEGDPLVNTFSDDPRVIVQDFLTSLTLERVGDLQEREPGGYSGRVGEFAAALVLVAAQLTRVFHTLSLQSSRPVSRWGAVVAQAPRHDGRFSLAHEVRPIRAALTFARQRLRDAPPAWTPGPEFTDAVEQLLDAVQANLAIADFYAVDLDHLREVTDVAWQCLVWDICGHSYPGWTELMLDLVLLQERTEAPVERRPRWRELVELSAQIERIIRPAAIRSWEQSKAGPPGTRRPAASKGSDATRDFYDAAATLLWRQAVVARSHRRGGESSGGEVDQVKVRMTAAGLPKAVAFVTSFDLELEMALLRARPEGERFLSVVVPVYLVNRREDAEGEFLWLEGVVELGKDIGSGEEALNCLTRPVQWRVMYQGRYELPEHPVVVRLTGSPLMQLPSPTTVPAATSGLDEDEDNLASDLRLVGVAQNKNNLFLHSATVDEYLALRQAEAEYFWVYSRNTFANISSRALPKALLACREPGPIRFWMTVGVPMKDPAVRLRVLSQMGSRRFMLGGRGEIPGVPRRDPTASGRAGNREIAGLAINWRLDDEESMLLSSLGLRVIKKGRAEDFTKHLVHHAWHLGAVAADDAPRAGIARCPEEPGLGRALR